jgi:hypothetical protein
VSGFREPERLEEHAAGISAGELARRARARSGHTLRADELERWLRVGGLAARSPTGLLVPTSRGVEIAEALAS